MWKQLLMSLLQAAGLAAVDAGSAIAKDKLTPRDPRDIGKSGKPSP